MDDHRDDHGDLVEKTAGQVVEAHDPRTTPLHELLGAVYDAGLAWVHFPVGLGGLGVSRGPQARTDEVLQGAGRPTRSSSTVPAACKSCSTA
jgi:hypothetical protein